MENEYELPTGKDASIAPEKPILLVTRQTVELKDVVPSKTIMIGQSISRADQANEETDASEDDAAQTAKQTESEYLVNVPYEGKITLTNLSSGRQSVEVLWQIPSGAISIPSGATGKPCTETDTASLEIDAFSTQTISYAFYFPSAGKFNQYSPCVARNDKAIARGESHTFNVVEQATQIDEKSWNYIAERGSVEQILSFLQSANLRKLDWSRVYHRLREPEVYKLLIKTLEDNQIFELAIYGYALHHKDDKALRKLLNSRQDVVAAVGPTFHSDLLSVDPVQRKIMEHLEFAPLVVPRIHPLREKLELTNAKLESQYTELLQSIAYSDRTDSATQLAVVYYQLINNRIDEALVRFRNIDAKTVHLQLQYDYLDAYLSLHQMDVDRSFEIASKYESHPINRWRSRFAELLSQINDVKNLQKPGQLANTKPSQDGVEPESGDLALIDRERRQLEAVNSQAVLKLKLEGDELKINYANTSKATVKLFAVDLELLFSKTPFVREGLERMAIAEPTAIDEVQFETQMGTTALRLPEKYRNQTLLVEVESGAARDTALYYGGQLSTFVAESFGQLQVMHSQTKQPLSGVYVKVYARHDNGEVRFFKDGYTDLRGRFDYSSISNNDLSTAQRLAILVLDNEHGATLHEVNNRNSFSDTVAIRQSLADALIQSYLRHR